MYCVRCGVKLQDGEKKCPLCGTAVINPDESDCEKENRYSEIYPKKQTTSSVPAAIALTAFSVIAITVILLICFKLYGRLSWGGYPVFGTLLSYIIFVLPLWFKKPNPVIFVPCDHVAIAAFLAYICYITGGNWFISFALPITLIFGAILTAAVTLFRYVPKGKYYILGGYFILLGGLAMLIELFEHITFSTTMFLWSIYPSIVLFMVGMFFILAGIIRPMREYLEKLFFT